MNKQVKGKVKSGKIKPRTRPYPYEFRLKIVRLHLEEGYSAKVLHEHFGLSTHSVTRWAKAYRQQGPDGLIAKRRGGCKPKLAGICGVSDAAISQIENRKWEPSVKLLKSLAEALEVDLNDLVIWLVQNLTRPLH
jgi:transcriptional regulator with XRE-family HTH domain